MEDILASIRRILSEDEAAPPAAGASEVAEPVAEPAAAPADDLLDLTEDMLVPEPVQASPPAPVAVAPPPPPAVPAAVPLPPAPAVAEDPLPDPDRSLLAPAVAAAAAASVGTLLRTVAADRSSNVNRGGPSIEDVVREEVRPLLKEWLDAHLPGLVERLVRSEIERVLGRALS